MSTTPRRRSLTTVLKTADLVLASGTAVPDLNIRSGFTMIHCRRESSATTLAMTIAGRMNPKKGTVTLMQRHRAWTKTGEIHKRVAFAGVPELSEVERLVTVHTAIRERAVWAGSWWKLTPRNIEKIPAYTTAAKLVEFNFDNATAKKTLVGELDLFDRVKLHVMQALISRPDPLALIVDDIDSLRSLILRRNFLHLLSRIATNFPVIVLTSNAADRQYTDEYLQVDITSKTVLSMPNADRGTALPKADRKAIESSESTEPAIVEGEIISETYLPADETPAD